MSDGPLGARMTVVEMRQEAQERRFDEHLVSEEKALAAQTKVNEGQLTLIAKLDERMNRQDVLYARLLGGVAVLVTVGQILAPIIVRAIGP